MKTIRLGLVLVALLFFQVFIAFIPLPVAQSSQSPDVYIGVDIAYGSTAEAKALIDQVSSYTNLIVIGTSQITYNVTRMNETCQYAYDKGLSFILWAPALFRRNTTAWLSNARKAWGDHFLGFYVFDEPAGRQLDMNETRILGNPVNYVDAADRFENTLDNQLDDVRTYYNSSNVQLFTSDYSLYWFDYKAGYDTVFAEFCWNYSRQFNVAICRGAATVQNKDWGVILLWKYTTPPYLGSGSELYKDMVLAYDNGAKYIVVFDSNKDWSGGILQTEHLQALQQFWQYVQNNPRKSTPASARTAFVLPDGYGYGFRGPGDAIWGLWNADDLSYNLSVAVSNLLTKHGASLDIIYDDGLQPGNNGYSKLIYWNDTSLVQPATPNSPPSTAPALDPQPPVQTEPSNPPPPIENPPSTTDYTLFAVAIAAIAGVAVPVVLLRKRQHCVTFATTGIGRDFTGTVVVVDGKPYDRYGATFWWDHGSRHTFEFKSPLTVNSGKQYVLESTNGLRGLDGDSLKASMEATVTGNYRLVLKADITSLFH
jgi:hypothetical protein